MAEIKWIKIVTDIFDDEKILLIETLPEADSIIVIWFKLLCLAGKQNNSGVFVMGNGLPYTDKMLAAIFRRKEATVSLALKTFEKFGMVQIVENVLTIPNWGRHQNFDKIELRNEYMKNYMREYRSKQKALIECKANSKTNVSEADKIREDKRREDKNKIERESMRGRTKAKPPAPQKPSRHKYGVYKNVLLSDEDMEKLKAEFSADWQERIDRLSEYMESTGKTYKNHLATIRSWARKDSNKKKEQEKKWSGTDDRPPSEILGI